jgi:hypothetical protein
MAQQQARLAGAVHMHSSGGGSGGSSSMRDGRPGDGLLHAMGARLAANALGGLMSAKGAAVPANGYRPRGSSMGGDTMQQGYVQE